MTAASGGMTDMDMHQSSCLSVRGLKTYFHTNEGVVKAVEGASFDLHAGRTLGIVGESGCGKSVAARSILRIVESRGRIAEGEIWLQRRNGERVDLVTLDANGREMRGIRGGEIGLVFQEPMTSFSPVHTIGNQIVEMIRLHKSGTDKRQAVEFAIGLMDQVGIPQPRRRFDEYAFQLSGGMRQRAMIAMALSCNPCVLIADEPTTALDVTTQAQILDLLRKLQADHGMSIALITHNLGVVAEMADEVAVMYLGQVVEQGSVEEVFHEPRHPYTQALLRSMPTMVSACRSRLPTVEGTLPNPYGRPRGCSFHPRCPSAQGGTCDKNEPKSVQTSSSGRVSCFLFGGD